MKKAGKIFRNILIWLFLSLLLLAAGAFVFFFLLYHGPSVHYRQRFVKEQLAAGRGGYLVTPFVNEEELRKLLEDAP